MFSRTTFFRTLALIPLALSTFCVQPVSAAPAPVVVSGGLSQHALNQIAALEQEAASRTPAQKRLDSNLLYESKMRRGLALATGVTTLRSGVSVDSNGLVLVDIDADVTDTLLSQIQASGGEIVNSFPKFHAIRALVPITQVETLAALPGIKFIKPAVKNLVYGAGHNRPMLPFVIAANEAASFSAPSSLDPAFHSPEEISLAQRGLNVRRQLTQSLQTLTASSKKSAVKGSGAGSLSAGGGGTNSYANDDPQGDVAHRADQARAHYYVSGSGIKVGVMSNGVDSLSSAESNGDLPTVNVLSGQGGSGDEGTAMLEIVHRLAPGAALDFATGNGGDANFANNIEALQADGCNIIVDDEYYFDESPFQDSTIAKAVDYVTKNGVAYFSSAGNAGNVIDGTAATWEGDFAASGYTINVSGGGKLASFGSSSHANPASTSGSTFAVTLFWSDPLGASSNDYNLFVLDSAEDTVEASSTNTQNGSQDPFEQCNVTDGEHIVVSQTSGAAARYLHLQMQTDGYGTLTYTTAGATHGHSSAIDSYLGYNGGIDGCFSVAATSAAAVYPNVFSTSDSIESFSSDGQRRVFYYSDGTPITSGNFSSTGGALLDRPNMTAADGVSTSVPSFPSFYGTSAAAPHAAAIAALAASDYAGISPIYVGYTEENTGIKIESGNFYDPDSGFGIVDALNTVGAYAPYNDNFENSAALSGASGSAIGTNQGASVEPGEPANAGVPNGRSVWYNWTSPSTGWFNFNTSGSSFDTTLGIYTGTAVNALTGIASNDDANGTLQSSATFLSYYSGTPYDVSVDGYAAEYGNIDLAWSQVAPPNDNFANYQYIGNGSSGTVYGNNQLATTESGEPYTGSATVWFAWTAPYSGDFNFDTFGSTVSDTVLGVYTGSSVNALTQVAFDDDSDISLQSSATFTAAGGTVYYIAVGGYNSSETGDLVLNWIPLALNSISVSPSSAPGGQTLTGTVTLNEDGASSGTVVALSSNNSAVTVPSSVTVIGGSYGSTPSATFTINTSSVSANTTATIIATYNGVSQTTTVTLTPSLASLTASPTTVIGGAANPSLVIALAGKATTTATIALTSSNPSALSVPASETINANYTTKTFTATSHTVSANTTVTITATYGGISKTATVIVTPPTLTSVTASPTSIVGGSANSTGTVTLSGNVIATTTINVTSSNSAALSVPYSVNIGSGYNSKTFTATSHAVSVPTTVTLTATYNGTSKTTTVTVNPSGPYLSSLVASPTSVVGGSANSSVTAALSAKATSTVTITLTSSNPSALSVPSSVTINPTYTTKTFTATSHAVTSNTTVTITATANGATQTTTVTVTPVVVALASVTASPTSVKGGSANSTGTVTLTSNATGTVAVSLSSSNPSALSVPATLNIGAGYNSKTFTATSHTVTASTNVTITASYNGVTKTTMVTVTP